MAGALVKLVPKRVFNFGTVTVGSTQTLTVVERIDISQYVDAVVSLRVHSADAAGGTITFELFGDGFTEEDPGVSFLTSSALFTAVAINSGMGTGPAYRAYGGTVRGHYAALRVAGNRTVGSPLTATVSIDLCLRAPDDTFTTPMTGMMPSSPMMPMS